MSNKTVGFILIIAIIVFFFVGYGGDLVHEISKYTLIVSGIYGGIKLVA